jgi:hypothetical protein
MPYDAIEMIQSAVARAVDQLEEQGAPKDQELVLPVEMEVIALTELAEFDLPRWVNVCAQAAGYPAGVIDPRVLRVTQADDQEDPWADLGRLG